MKTLNINSAKDKQREVCKVARIAGVDLPKNKRMEIALTYIYGIGRTKSKMILNEAGIDLDTKTDKPSR